MNRKQSSQFPPKKMDWFISSLMCFLFTLALAHIIGSILRGGKTRSGKLPPGPVPRPVVGNILELGDKPHQSLAKLAKIHGPLMSLKLGQITTIVISSPSMAKEVLQKHDLIFANRSPPNAVHALDHHMNSVAWLPAGAPWRSLRKVCNSHIFTVQKLDANQELRRSKIDELMVDVQESCRQGKAVNIGEASFKAVLAALSSTILSQDLANSSLDYVLEFKKAVRLAVEIAANPNLSDFFPALRRIDPQGIRRSMGKHCGKLLDTFDRIIEERLQLRKVPGYVPSNDMLDTLLTIREKNSEEMDRKRIKHLFLDLFVAGTDTTAGTVEWAMAELLRHPKTMSKAQEEIRQIIGKEKLLEESDVPRLPYLQAVIKETLRLHPAGPLLLPRDAAADIEINGFVVPKGARVLVNAWAINRNPSAWENPDSFVPERFLGSNIELKGQHFEFIPFGSGRRICVGMPLANRMLPLMVGSLIKSYDWKLEGGVTPESIDMEERFGLALQKAQPLRAIPIQV